MTTLPATGDLVHARTGSNMTWWLLVVNPDLNPQKGYVEVRILHSIGWRPGFTPVGEITIFNLASLTPLAEVL